MNSITSESQTDKRVSTSILSFSKKHRIWSLLKQSNAYKTKGFSVMGVFLYIFSLVFTGRSMYMNFSTGTHNGAFAKDTVYRFLKNTSINWSKFTALLAAQIASESIIPLTSEDRIKILIIDDTLFERSGAKNVELAARVFDHVSMKFKRGFRLLTLGWSDGTTFLPVASRLLSSEKDKNIYCNSNILDKRTTAYRIRTEARTKATVMMLNLIEQAKNAGIQATHVLFDTWFCSPSTLIDVKKSGYDTVAMAKKTTKIHYTYQGEALNVKEIFKRNKKRRGRSKDLLSVEITLTKDGNSIPAKLEYVRNRNKRKDWLVLITTDLTLTEEEVIALYGRKWDIEVFFKVSKTYLKLAKEWKVLSYDAMTAHVAFVFSRYMMLAIENRSESDMRTIGELFYYLVDELKDISFMESLSLIMQML